MIPSEFFPPHQGMRLAEFAASLDLHLADAAAATRIVRSVSPIHRAVEGDVCYILSRKNRAELDTCRASAIICAEEMAPLVPNHIAVLLSKNPHVAFARAGALLHPDAMIPAAYVPWSGMSRLALVLPGA